MDFFKRKVLGQFTPLHDAAFRGSLSEVQKLIQLQNLNVNKQDKNGCIPLHWATQEGHLDVVKELIRMGSDPNIFEEDGNNCLHIAVKQGHVKIVKILLKDGGISPNIKNRVEGCTSLYYVVQAGKEIKGNCLPIVKELLHYKANPNDACKDLWTPLHIAAREGYLDVVQELLNKGANPNCREEDSWTPLHLAVQWNHADVVLELIQHGADPNLECDQVKCEQDYLPQANMGMKYGGKKPIDLAKNDSIRRLLQGEKVPKKEIQNVSKHAAKHKDKINQQQQAQQQMYQAQQIHNNPQMQQQHIDQQRNYMMQNPHHQMPFPPPGMPEMGYPFPPPFHGPPPRNGLYHVQSMSFATPQQYQNDPMMNPRFHHPNMFRGPNPSMGEMSSMQFPQVLKQQSEGPYPTKRPESPTLIDFNDDFNANPSQQQGGMSISRGHTVDDLLGHLSAEPPLDIEKSSSADDHVTAKSEKSQESKSYQENNNTINGVNHTNSTHPKSAKESENSAQKSIDIKHEDSVSKPAEDIVKVSKGLPAASKSKQVNQQLQNGSKQLQQPHTPVQSQPSQQNQQQQLLAQPQSQDDINVGNKAKTPNNQPKNMAASVNNGEMQLKKQTETNMKLVGQLKDMDMYIKKLEKDNYILRQQFGDLDKAFHFRGKEVELLQKSVQDLRQQLVAKQQNVSPALPNTLYGMQMKIYSYKELAQCCGKFSEENKLGEGGFGPVYKGNLKGMDVAIKVLAQNSLQGEEQFRREVEVLARCRHPNIVLLVGASTEWQCLVYELMKKGSLEDRLACKGGSAPLQWQDRVRISMESASALQFLHSFESEPIFHRDFKPANVLLDHNMTAKLADAGLARVAAEMGGSTKTYVQDEIPVGTMAYVDPEYIQTGKYRAASDVYSFGVTLLQMITGWVDPRGIIEKVEEAYEKQELSSILDSKAGNWPKDMGEEMIKIALQCIEQRARKRPSLENEVLKKLRDMYDQIVERQMEQQSESATINYETKNLKDDKVPAEFLCPITQQIMQDPVVSADGFTYERMAIISWFMRDNRSPLTRKPLPHFDLVANMLLRLTIGRWMKAHPKFQQQVQQQQQQQQQQAVQKPPSPTPAQSASKE